jgi:hypothetical protein
MIKTHKERDRGEREKESERESERERETEERERQRKEREIREEIYNKEINKTKFLTKTPFCNHECLICSNTCSLWLTYNTVSFRFFLNVNKEGKQTDGWKRAVLTQPHASPSQDFFLSRSPSFFFNTPVVGMTKTLVRFTDYSFLPLPSHPHTQIYPPICALNPSIHLHAHILT